MQFTPVQPSQPHAITWPSVPATSAGSAAPADPIIRVTGNADGHSAASGALAIASIRSNPVVTTTIISPEDAPPAAPVSALVATPGVTSVAAHEHNQPEHNQTDALWAAPAALIRAFEGAGCELRLMSKGVAAFLDPDLFADLPPSQDYTVLRFGVSPRPGEDEATISCSVFAPTTWALAWASAPAASRPLAPVTLALHGVCHGEWYWAPWAAHLAARHQRIVVAVTMPLHGQGDDHSDWPGHPIDDVTLEQQQLAVARVKAALEQALDLPMGWIDLLGHSAGATLATEIARRAAEQQAATGSADALYRTVTLLCGIPAELIGQSIGPLLGAMIRHRRLKMLWRSVVRQDTLAFFATSQAAAFSLFGAHGAEAVIARVTPRLCPESRRILRQTHAVGAANTQYTTSHAGHPRSLSGQRVVVLAAGQDRLIPIRVAREGARLLDRAPFHLMPSAHHDLALDPACGPSGHSAWVEACDVYAQVVAS